MIEYTQLLSLRVKRSNLLVNKEKPVAFPQSCAKNAQREMLKKSYSVVRKKLTESNPVAGSLNL